ncbi:MAG: hypothetical protein H6653_10325 [Ardenticatenaceae bacterium]|nr:hypothetical protein [Ardenticatenaceae bacterium]
MKATSKWFTICLLCLLSLAACTPPAETVEVTRPVVVTDAATAVPATAETETPTTATDEPTATAVAEQPTTVPTPAATVEQSTAVPTADATDLTLNGLATLVYATLPPGAFERVYTWPLTVPAGERPLWVAYTIGYLHYGANPVVGHFVAIYTQEDGRWQEVAYQSLHAEPVEGETIGFGPEIIFEESLEQVAFTPGDTANLWLIMEGGVGAHSGIFQLLRFDGTTLHIEKTAVNSSPDVSFLEDLNGDGTPELILQQHDYYVFCYACGVRYLKFDVYNWDNASQQLFAPTLQPLPAAVQNHPAYQPNNRAVELATAGLWPDALAQIEWAEQAALGTAVPDHAAILQWNATLIRLYEQAYREELAWTPYPLLTNIFYGDYAAALNIVRGYGSEQIFTTASPLIQGTVAESNEQWLADYLLQQSSAAIAVPNLDTTTLAAAYYFHAWGTYLQNPADAQITADLQQAASLSPNEPLFNQVAPPDVNRIQFGPGETAALLEGDLPAQGSDVYVLSAQAGQNMIVMLTVPDEAARVAVQDSAGNYLNGQMASTLWQGTLPESGDYVIRVIGSETAASAGSGQAVSYSLQVIIPQRITFAPGTTSATIEGDVAAYEADDYILAAQEGQTMRVSITSPGANVLLTIVGADGIPLTNGNMSGATTWQGELPATQDYTIRAIGTLEPNSYTLTVTIE